MGSDYEFAADGAVMVVGKGMEPPISGYDRWIGKRTLELDYKQTYTAIKQADKDSATASKLIQRR